MSYFDYALEWCYQFADVFLPEGNSLAFLVLSTLQFICSVLPFVLVPYVIHRFVMLIVRLKNGY